MIRTVAVFALLLSLACADPEPTYLIDPPDDGDDDRYGVAVVERDFRVRVEDTVSTVIYIPTDRPDALADGPFPVALLLHGGFVKPHEYSWLALHLAQRGFLVVAPEHAFDLAIFSTGNGADVVEALDGATNRSGDLFEGRVDDRPALATGHSLGGVIATKTWLRRPQRFSHLLLLQSVPDEADAQQLAEERPEDHRVFAIAGERDGRIPPENIVDDLQLFSMDVPLAIIEGQNHFQLVDGPAPSRYERDNPASVDADEGKQTLLATIDLFVDAYLDEQAPDFGDHSLWPDGVISWDEYREQQ